MDWSRLKFREKAALAVLAGVFFFGLYWRIVREPVAKKVTSYKAQILKSQAQLKGLMSKEPQDKQVADKIQSLEEEDKLLSNQIELLENQIPSRFNMAQLVGEFTRLAKEIKLDSVKQRIAKEQGYSKIFLEVKFFSTYLNAIKYIAAIESISPFLRVEEMEILEPKEKKIEIGGSSVRLLVSCLLSDNPEGGALKGAQTPDNLPGQRDILASNARPVELLPESQFSLEGITFDLKNSSAIINGDVFQVNSTVGGYKVKKILSDSVILSDGTVDHVLSLKGSQAEFKK